MKENNIKIAAIAECRPERLKNAGKELDVPENMQIVVEDTLDAYGKIGAYNRSLFNGKVIGLTGSSGKTTTKEIVAILPKIVIYAIYDNNDRKFSYSQLMDKVLILEQIHQKV